MGVQNGIVLYTEGRQCVIFFIIFHIISLIILINNFFDYNVPFLL